jgi:hypothetical protein
MLSITREQAERLLKESHRAKAMVKRAKETAHATIKTVVDTTEVGGAAFAFGVINGRMGGVEFVGMPLDLVAALALHGMGFLLDGEYSEHLHNFGNGALATYLATMGSSIGHEMAVKAGKVPDPLKHMLLPGGMSQPSFIDNQALINQAKELADKRKAAAATSGMSIDELEALANT